VRLIFTVLSLLAINSKLPVFISAAQQSICRCISKPKGKSNPICTFLHLLYVCIRIYLHLYVIASVCLLCIVSIFICLRLYPRITCNIKVTDLICLVDSESTAQFPTFHLSSHLSSLNDGQKNTFTGQMGTRKSIIAGSFWHKVQ
jgi:hypothetical protein